MEPGRGGGGYVTPIFFLPGIVCHVVFTNVSSKIVQNLGSDFYIIHHTAPRWQKIRW